MNNLPSVNRQNWRKVLRELDISRFPSLSPFLKQIREKMLSKEKLLVKEELLGFAGMVKFVESHEQELNKFYVDNVDFTRFSKRMPYEFQKEGVRFLLKNNRCILADDMGIGKCNSLTTNVLHKNGWKTMGETKVGDMVFGRDGCLHKVTGYYPQGKKNIYRITFSDNCTAESCDEHLWNVRSVNDKKRRGEDFWRTVQLKDIMYDIQYKNRSYKWEIPICQPIQYDKKQLVIPPYILGVLIADGSISNGHFSFCPGNEEVPKIVNSFLDCEDVIRCERDYGTSNYYSFNDKKKKIYKEYINSIGLDVIGDYKFIPNDYKHASIEQRIQLLQGLMDSDGTTLKARTRYSTVSKDLADDIVELVQSLGGLASVSIVPGGRKWRPDLNRFLDFQDSYQINVQTSFCPFLRPYHIARWKRSNKLIRNIVSVDYKGSEEAACISVDAIDQLYIVDNYVVTHNTMTSIYAVLNMEDEHKILIVTLKSLKYNFANEIKYFDKRVAIVNKKWESDKFTIVHYDAFKKFQKNIIEENFSIVILDEAHKIRNHKTIRAKAVFDTMRVIRPAKIWLLTGTPIDNRPADYYSLLHLIKHPVANNWVEYVQRYCAAFQDQWGHWNTSGASNLEELNHLTKDVFLRRLKSTVGIEMPKKVRNQLVLELENRKGYNQVIEDYKKKKHAELVEEVGYTRDFESINVEEITQIMLQRQFCALEKIRDGSLAEIVEDYLETDDTNKIIVFTNFTKVIDTIKEEFGDICLTLDGRILDPKKRQEIVDRFNTDPTVKVFAVNMKVGGTGYNIQAANKVIVNDMDWVPSSMLQAEDRAWRIGQLRDVEIIYLLYGDTVEVNLYLTIEKKMKIVSTIIEGKSEKYFHDSVFELDEKSEKEERIDLIREILAQIGS